jgi:type IV secretory pathway VirB2 component (pilin)
MTQTTTQPPPAAATNPGDLLLCLIVTCLAPMFLSVAGGNLDLARLAALETINSYRTRNHADLIAVAQIVAFGLAALFSLSRSMDDGISDNLALRLRGNANALNRSAEQTRRALAETAPPPPPEPPAPDPDDEPIDEEYEAAVIANLAAVRQEIKEAKAALYGDASNQATLHSPAPGARRTPPFANPRHDPS